MIIIHDSFYLIHIGSIHLDLYRQAIPRLLTWFINNKDSDSLFQKKKKFVSKDVFSVSEQNTNSASNYAFSD